MSSQLIALLFDGLLETLVMVGVSGGIGALFGIPLGVILILTDRGGILQNLPLNRVLGLLINAARSTPFTSRASFAICGPRISRRASRRRSRGSRRAGSCSSTTLLSTPQPRQG